VKKMYKKHLYMICIFLILDCHKPNTRDNFCVCDHEIHVKKMYKKHLYMICIFSIFILPQTEFSGFRQKRSIFLIPTIRKAGLHQDHGFNT
jgi:hypothetical protein